MKYADFLKMYYLLADGVLKRSADPKTSCQKIMDQLVKEGIVSPKDEKGQLNFQFGISKLFFRVGMMAKIETHRENKMSKLIPTMQSAIRGMIARRVFNASKEREGAVRVIQNAIRQWYDWKNWPWFALFQKIKKDIKRVDWDALLQKAESDKAAHLKALAQVQAEKDRLALQLKQLEESIGTYEGNLANAKTQHGELQDKFHYVDSERANLKKQMADKEADLDDILTQLSAGDSKIRSPT